MADTPFPQTLHPTGKSLFSQHYLETRLPSHSEWAEDPQAAFHAVQALWHKARQFGQAWNEAQTEDEFVKPVLAALGWSYIPQVKNSRSGRVNRPDYALFADEATKNAAYPHQGNDDAFYPRALAIAEAKYWGRPLSRKDSSGRDTWKTDNNPSHQMVSYLVGTRCPWGILTNGQIWRLYSREVSSTASEYYEVDLAAIFASSDLSDLSDSLTSGILTSDPLTSAPLTSAFKRFWLFFRRAAFVPDSQGRSFIQRIHEGSASYAKEISEKLKELVFDEVMPEIAAGFVAYRRQQLGVEQETEESLRQIYRGSLSLLYKLLFVLYAESRSLLPIQNPAYWEESLTRMARQFADRLDRGQAISDATHATRQYDALLALFNRIDKGDASLAIPRYDGGLFNPATPDNQFLTQHKLSDRAVARAVDILVRDAGQPVDYAYISVRNLGSIYEGLLENRLEISDGGRTTADGGPQTADGSSSASSGQPSAIGRPPSAVRRLPSAVVLVNDKGERKATGSYYTPDYIVRYIVEQTLTPILDERQGQFAAAMDRCATLRGKLEHTASPAAIALLRRELETAERQAAEAFLGITCCDPAMGSGHFLVNAVDFITDGIIERLQAYHDSRLAVPWAWNPIQRLIERVRQDILEEMAQQGIAMDPARLDDTSLLTRLVMKRCIYGVDLNPMAVELAKLSLWLHSFTVGAPLSFLDHHLRWGNSLIGADVRTVERAISQTDSGQLGLFGGPFAGLLDLTTTMLQIAGRADSTLADVRKSAEEFTRFQAELTPYKQVLDIWVSQHFGNKAGGEFLALYGDDVLPVVKGLRPVSPAHQAAIEQARALWQDKRFFHWDLEFPEVFVDLARRDWAENPGFDAVIGNPPYVRQEQLAPLKPYFTVNFAEAYHGVADLSTYFLVQGLRVLKQNGRLAYITSGTFTRLNSGTPLRQYLVARSSLEEIVNLGEQQVFAGATTYPIILVLRNSLPSPEHTVLVHQVDEIAELTRKEGETRYPAPVGKAAWIFANLKLRHVLEGWSGAQSLGEFLDKPIYRGVSTGLNEAFVIDEATRVKLIRATPMSADLIKPYVRGEDLRRWYRRESGNWLLFSRRGIDIKVYPAVEAHLQQYRERLEPRPPNWQGSAWPGRKPGMYQWYEIQDTVEYFPVFESPRLHSTKVTLFPMFSLSQKTTYAANTSYVLPIPDISAGYYLLGLLNSIVCEYFCRTVFSPKANGYYEVQPGELTRFPVPSATTLDREAIAALALAITEQARARYTLHRQTHHRILTDLGQAGASLNQKLTAWWELDFAGFMAEVRKVFKREIPLRQRDDWEEWLASRRAEHEQRTAEIVRLETQLNARVYALFDLTPAEIKIVVESTKYRYGEV